AAAQHVGEELTVVAGAHGFNRLSVPRGALENRIGRHHAGRVGSKGAKEWTNVIIEVRARERREPAVEVVAVESVFRGAVPHPVLQDGENASGMEAGFTVLEC